MRVQFDLVGSTLSSSDWRQSFKVEMDAIPRVGDVVNIQGLSQGNTVVRTVVWYPFGEDPEENKVPDTTPFVYVVIGQARPS